MPRYRFSSPDRWEVVDGHEMELPDLVAARREAVRLIASVLGDSPGVLGMADTFWIQVHDEADRCLFIVGANVIPVACAQGG